MTGEASIEAVAAAVDQIRGRLGETSPVTVAVVGDVMLDRYTDGTSTRLSPEAPVPVVDVTGRYERLGGAANVAAGLAALGVRTRLVGLVGSDPVGARLEKLLADIPNVDARLVTDPDRPTTIKERVRADGRHLVRIDQGITRPIAGRIDDELTDVAQEALRGADVLVISDYAKGAIAVDLVTRLADRPRTIVDPKHPDVERYQGAQVFAPNRAEALAAAGIGPDAGALDVAARDLAGRLPGTSLVITCGADGIVWRNRTAADGDPLGTQPSLARRVRDVTGAGDSVVCGLAAALATDHDLVAAISLASAIAAVAVESPGTATPSWAEIDALIAASDR